MWQATPGWDGRDDRDAEAYACRSRRAHLLVIGAIVALTIAASIVASLSFGRVEQTGRSLVDEHYPVVEFSRELALVAGATVATAPKLAEVAADGEREAIVKRLGEGEARMRAIVDDLHKRNAVDRARVIALLDELAANVQQMNNAARARIMIESQRPKSRSA